MNHRDVFGQGGPEEAPSSLCDPGVPWDSKHGMALWSGWARHRCMCIPYSHRNTSLLAGVSKKTIHKAREDKLQPSDYITMMKDGSHKLMLAPNHDGMYVPGMFSLESGIWNWANLSLKWLMIFWDGQVYLDLKKLSFLPPNIIIAQSKDLVKF